MEPNPFTYYFRILTQEEVKEIQNSPVEAQYSVTDWENTMFNISQFEQNVLQASPLITLQVRGEFLVQVLPFPYTILSGFRFDYEIKFEVIQQLEKSELKKIKQNCYVGLSFTFPQPQSSNAKFICQNTHQFKRFIRVLQRNYIVQLNFHGAFQPIKKVGRGVTASVFKACRLEDKKNLAIKTFKKEAYFPTQNGNGQKAFKNEFKILTKLKHKNICQFEGVYETNNSIYLVMEYFEVSLYSYILASKFFSERHAKKIIFQLLKGLEHMHDNGLMHRDLKLENIMVKKVIPVTSPEVAIIDLGLAEHVDNENFLYTRCGTPGYVAPQVLQIKGNQKKRYSAVCDIFSLGVIFHILLFKKSLFEGKDVKEVIKKNSECQINEYANYFSNASPEAVDLLLQMLKKDPKQRISASEALRHSYFLQFHEKQLFKIGETEVKIEVNI